MKKSLTKLLIFGLITFLFINVPVITNAEQGEYDVNSPLVKEIADMFSMEGHSEHDIATCATKQRYFEEIVHLLNEEGKSKEEIIEMYTEMFGEQGLRAPKKTGFSLLAWTTPFVVLLLSGMALFIRVKSHINRVSDISLEEEATNLNSIDKDIYSTMIEEERKKNY